MFRLHQVYLFLHHLLLALTSINFLLKNSTINTNKSIKMNGEEKQFLTARIKIEPSLWGAGRIYKSYGRQLLIIRKPENEKSLNSENGITGKSR